MKPILPSINDIDFKQLNTNDMPVPSLELMDAFIRDLKNHESGSLVPETSGADYFFIRNFITEDWKEDEYVAGCLKHLGYPGDYLYRCMQNHMGLPIQFTRTLAVLRTVYPKREFAFDEIQRYAHLYSAISALVDVSEELDNVNREMLGLETGYATWEEDTFFIRRT